MKSPFQLLSRRERQILDSLYSRGQATVDEVRSDLPDPPTPAAVRATLLRLEDGGHVVKHPDGPRNVFQPSLPPSTARRSALLHLIETFFGGSREKALTAILEDGDFSEEELERYEKLIEDTRGRSS